MCADVCKYKNFKWARFSSIFRGLILETLFKNSNFSTIKIGDLAISSKI